jgi:hypothetical protein
VCAQLDGDLEQDPPATGTTKPVVVVEGLPDEAAQRALDVAVPRQRARQSDDRAVDHLGADVVRQGHEVLEGCELARRVHDVRVAAGARAYERAWSGARAPR